MKVAQVNLNLFKYFQDFHIFQYFEDNIPSWTNSLLANLAKTRNPDVVIYLLVIITTGSKSIDSIKKIRSQWVTKIYQALVKQLETSNSTDLLFKGLCQMLLHFPTAAKPVKEVIIKLVVIKFSTDNYNEHVVTALVRLYSVGPLHTEDSLIGRTISSIYYILNTIFELNQNLVLYSRKFPVDNSNSCLLKETKKLFKLLKVIIQSETTAAVNQLVDLFTFIFGLNHTTHPNYMSVVQMAEELFVVLVKSLGNTFILKKKLKNILKLIRPNESFAKQTYFNLHTVMAELNYFDTAEEFEYLFEHIQEELQQYSHKLSIFSETVLLSLTHVPKNMANEISTILVNVALRSAMFKFDVGLFPAVSMELITTLLHILVLLAAQDRSAYAIVVKLVATGLNHPNGNIQTFCKTQFEMLILVVKPKLQPTVKASQNGESAQMLPFMEQASKRVKLTEVEPKAKSPVPMEPKIAVLQKSSAKGQDIQQTVQLSVEPKLNQVEFKERSILDLPKRISEKDEEKSASQQEERIESEFPNIPVKRSYEVAANLVPTADVDSEGESSFPMINLDDGDSEEE
ncbi:hypothetical protein HDV01_002918 [Terramyces sp. JEL0728]|nr:hypothetical protein HDV01_002918 [Terramyces sp. JEL0728]